MKKFFQHMLNYLRIKFNTLLSFLKLKKKKNEVLFCKETQRVISVKAFKKLAEKENLEKNIVKFRLLKNREKSERATFRSDKETKTFHHL